MCNDIIVRHRKHDTIIEKNQNTVDVPGFQSVLFLFSIGCRLYFFENAFLQIANVF